MIRLLPPGDQEIGGGGGGDGLEIVTGVEIDTGDTVNGNTVYGKYINFGSLPNNGTKNVSHGISGLIDVIALEGVADTGSDQWHLAYTNGIQYAILRANGSSIRISTNFNWTSVSGRVYIEYTRS